MLATVFDDLHRAAEFIRGAVSRYRLTADEVYLSQSVDAADFERRAEQIALRSASDGIVRWAN